MIEHAFPIDDESVKVRSEKIIGFLKDNIAQFYSDQDAQKFIFNEKNRESLARHPYSELSKIPQGKFKNHLLKLFNEIKPKIGQVSLTIANDYSSRSRYLEDRLASNRRYTHMVSSGRYQVVLYDTEVTRGIHPVSDEALFTEPLSHSKKTELIHSAVKKGKFSKEGQEAMKFGYKFSDSAHVRYLTLSGIGGFKVYYFACNEFVGPSLVDAEGSQISDEDN